MAVPVLVASKSQVPSLRCKGMYGEVGRSQEEEATRGVAWLGWAVVQGARCPGGQPSPAGLGLHALLACAAAAATAKLLPGKNTRVGLSKYPGMELLVP